MKKMNISNTTYELIGRLSIEYNRLQFFTAYLFNSFKVSTKTGFNILKNKGFPKLLNKIRVYAKELQISRDDEFALTELLENINNCRIERNKYFHSLISKTEKDLTEKAILFFDSIEENQTIIMEVTHEDIEDLINEIKNLSMQLIYVTLNIEKLVN